MTTDSSESSRQAGAPRFAFIVVVLVILLALVALIGFHQHTRPKSLGREAELVADTKISAFRKPAPRPSSFEGWPELRTKPASNLHQLINVLGNASAPLLTRRTVARALALDGSDDAIAALKKVLLDGPVSLQATIAEALGESTNPEAPALLEQLLQSSEESVARGAVRGLAARGGESALESLKQILIDQSRTLNLRTESALALGDVNLPDASMVLIEALSGAKDSAVIESILMGLGKRPLSETEAFFESYLRSTENSIQARAAAIEALSNSADDVSPLLMNCLGDPDPSIRAAAAWALSTTDRQNLGTELSRLLQDETSPEVRIRLYQALENQSDADSRMVLGCAQYETTPLVRLAGLDCLAGQLRRAPTPELVTFFDQIAFPELGRGALNSKDAQIRLGSVIALSRAGPAASPVLQNVISQSRDPKIVQAAQTALKAINKQAARSIVF